MSDFAIIADLERRQFGNQARAVVRSPLRLTMWVASLTLGIAFVVVRLLAVRTGHRMPMPDVTTLVAGLYDAVFLGSLGFWAIRNSGREGARFANVVEANVVASSTLGARSVFVWLQARALWRAVLRTLIVLLILGTSDLAHVGQMPRLALLGLLIVLLPATYAFHLSIASQRVRTIARVAGILALVGAACIALARLPGSPIVVHVPSVALAAAHGAWWPFAIALVALAASFALPTRDPLPDLYAATVAGAAGTRNQAARSPRAPRDGRTSDWLFDLPGPWALVSARMAAFLRARTPTLFAVGLAGWFALGLAAGIAQRVVDVEIATALFSGVLSIAFITLILFASIGYQLAGDVRNPLWWAGDASLSWRLAADSLATTARLAVSVLAAVVGYASAGHASEAAVTFALFTAFAWLARCSGYLLYAYFPSRVDQRGGLAGLRVFVVFALAAPVAALGIAGAILGINVYGLSGLVFGASLVEAVVLLVLAAKRIDGRVEAYVTA